MFSKVSFLKGFVWAAFLAIFVYESVALCSALDSVGTKFDGYCNLSPLRKCLDQGCRSYSLGPNEGKYRCVFVLNENGGPGEQEFCDCE